MNDARVKVAGRRPNRERKTPRLDAWLEKVQPLLAEHGKKAELARFLAGTDTNTQQVRGIISTLQKVLTGKTVPNGELVLGINAWLASQK